MPQHDSILMTAAVTKIGNNKQPILDLQFLDGNHFTLSGFSQELSGLFSY